MSQYKRNQVQEAISKLLEPKSQGPSTELHTRLKRLLETDRALGRSPRSTNPELATYAFYSDDAPGSGIEVWFSGYEAFALFNGLCLMMHGWPQSFAVLVMRRVRADLERHHARILKLDPKLLFDQEIIRKSAREGDMAFNNTAPVLLTIVSKTGSKRETEDQPFACSVCDGPQEAMNWAWQIAKGIGGISMFELTGNAHALATRLAHTEPHYRGRGA